MKRFFSTFFALLAMAAVCRGADPTPAELQALGSDVSVLQQAVAADTQAQAAVAANTSAVATAQGTLAASQSAQAVTAAGVTSAETQLQADVNILFATANRKVQGPMPMPPHGDFHQEHGDFHQEHPDFHPDFHSDFHPGWGGGWQGPHYEINPWNFVAPVINNIATGPRMVVNPMTGQAQLMSPGQWVLVNAGTPLQSYTWQPLPLWPLGAEKAATKTASRSKAVKPAHVRPLRRLVIHFHLL